MTTSQILALIVPALLLVGATYWCGRMDGYWKRAAEERRRLDRYRRAVDDLDKWCGFEFPQARLIAAHLQAVGEGRGLNAGTPCGDEPCVISGLREQLRRMARTTPAPTPASRRGFAAASVEPAPQRSRQAEAFTPISSASVETDQPWPRAYSRHSEPAPELERFVSGGGGDFGGGGAGGSWGDSAPAPSCDSSSYGSDSGSSSSDSSSTSCSSD